MKGYYLLMMLLTGMAAFAAPPQVTTTTEYARGATMAYSGGTIASSTGISEKGVVWASVHNPTVADNKATATGNALTFVARMNDLQPATLYYVRAYATNTAGETGYGDEIKLITIPKGNNTFTMNIDSASLPAHYNRIKAAMTSACNYHNNLTSIVSTKSVNYGSGTPTAEASYGGWMRFGPSESYQRTGTALHEMSHTIGVGQHSNWTSNTYYRADGKWLGERTTALLNFMRPLHGDNTYAEIHGDSQHFWPFGINGASEDTGADLLYVMNSLLGQAMGEDGLPPTSAYNFATPAYTFDLAEGKKYYIKNEDPRAGRDTTFVIETPTGKLVYRTMTASEALANDSAAWYITFNPQTRYYSIQNVATGKYFTYVSSSETSMQSVSGAGLNATRISSDGLPNNANMWFQLLAGRGSTWVGADTVAVKMKGFWIIHPQNSATPYVWRAASLGATANGAFTTTETSAKLQRWLLLSEDEVQRFDAAFAVNGKFNLEAGATYSIRPLGSTLCLRAQVNPDSLDIVTYTPTSEQLYAAMRWEVSPVNTSANTPYTFTNIRTGKRLTIESWTSGNGYPHTRALTADDTNTDQHLNLTFVGNTEVNGQLVQTFTIGNSDKFLLDNYGTLVHRTRVGNTKNTTTTIPSNQQWALVLETQAPSALPAVQTPDDLQIYVENRRVMIDRLPKDATVQIYDMAGRPCNNTTLTAGVYIVSVRSEQQYIRKKIIIN
jgi:hypothetical protein